MRYFANPSTPPVVEAMLAGRLGAILTPRQRLTIPAGVVWCADNGCYGKGYPGETAWWAWLEALTRTYDRALCSFAVAPDVVGDAAATLARSAPWLQRIRDLGVPAAFVAQDGIEQTPPPWGEFDVLFIGGTDAFKLGRSAQFVTAEARARGLEVHCGRVNSRKRIQMAALIGCTSADGTFIRFGPDRNLPIVLSWLTELRDQVTM